MPLNLEKIRKLIGNRTITEVAAEANMQRSGLSRVLSGRFDPKLSTVERLASALGVRAKDILEA